MSPEPENGPNFRYLLKAAPIAGKPVPLAERAPRLAEIARRRTELESQEERGIMCAQREGLEFDRREDAPPSS